MRRHAKALIAVFVVLLVLGVPNGLAADGPPSINRFYASEISGSLATLNATIDPAGHDTSYRFEYTTDEDFEANGFTGATRVPVPDGEIASNASSPDETSGSPSLPRVSQSIGGLTPATVYRFRVVAENSIDTTTSAAKAFRTFPPQTSPTPGAFPGQGFLPDNRAWELVSPPDKLGADINGTSARIRIAADGSAVGFSSLGAFADAAGTGVTVDYLAERTGTGGTNGWSTHGIVPPQAPLSQPGAAALIDPRYYGDFSPDLDRGVFFARSPLTDDPSVAEVPNLYLRPDLRSSGEGTYKLLTACPLCAEEGKPLPPLKAPVIRGPMNPQLGGATPDLSRVVFELRRRLTADTPKQSPLCDPETFFSRFCAFQAYESDGNEIHYVGRIPVSPPISCDEGDTACEEASPEPPPISCDDAGEPVCGGAPISHLAQGIYAEYATISMPNVISDGSDGHSRVFFTFPTPDGVTPNLELGAPGKVYARIDRTQTVQLDASERTDCAGDPSCGGDAEPDPAPESFVPARYVGATPDGERAFITTAEALTDDAPPAGGVVNDEKLYMYDLTKPASDPHNLTLINADHEPSDGYGLLNLVGYSRDGSYVYFEAEGGLISGEPHANFGGGGAENLPGIYLWHEGTLTYVGSGEKYLRAGHTLAVTPGGPFIGTPENSTMTEWNGHPRMARVTPDGRHLLFATYHGAGLLSVRGGVDHECIECRELYLYSADEDRLQCVSCNPTGAPAIGGGAADVTGGEGLGRGTTRGDTHETTALSNDGRYVFFSSSERLVAADRNGPCKSKFPPELITRPNKEGSTCTDAYAFDSTTSKISLLSSGEDSTSSFFLEATPDGKNALIDTRERLSGWDVDNAYDIYDVRVGGGFPEPPPPPPSCQGDACQPAPVSLNDPTPASSAFAGQGNQPRKTNKKKHHNRKAKKHRQAKHKQGKKQKRPANNNGRASR